MDTLLTEWANYRLSGEYAADIGLDSQALVRYATGACSVSERQMMESIISRCRWAQQFIAETVIKLRPGSLSV